MIYFIVYGDANTTNCNGPIAGLSQAQSAFDWFKSLSGITYVQLLSINADTVSSWGTPPA